MCFTKRKIGFIMLSFFCLILILLNFTIGKSMQVCAYSYMPFYDLRPCELSLRAKFSTEYKSSSAERKNNIKLASKAIDNYLLDVGAEFSFNQTVGPRTEKRGYMQAKIIVNGEFVDGIGGGVCQVSTTLYNAVLLAGLKVTEYHPHSLPVSYVAPSFDAMVNSGGADLKFVNNTYNPIIINTFANDEILTISITGETMMESYVRQSVLKEEIPAPEEQIILDEKGEYPDLLEGESKVIAYSKKGYKSEGYLLKKINGEIVEKTKIRSDRYAPRKGLIVYGQTKREEEKNFLLNWFLNKFLQI